MQCVFIRSYFDHPIFISIWPIGSWITACSGDYHHPQPIQMRLSPVPWNIPISFKLSSSLRPIHVICLDDEPVASHRSDLEKVKRITERDADSLPNRSDPCRLDPRPPLPSESNSDLSPPGEFFPLTISILGGLLFSRRLFTRQSRADRWIKEARVLRCDLIGWFCIFIYIWVFG